MPYVLLTSIFVVLAPPDNLTIGQIIAREFPTESLQLWPGQWLVVSAGTAKEISDRLGVSAAKGGVAVVFSTNGYFGWAATPIWEWMAAKLGQAQSA